MNEFQMYEHLRYKCYYCRAYQLHCNRLENQSVDVPKHISYSPSVPNLYKAK